VNIQAMETEFGKVAQQAMARELTAVREAFSNSEVIEAMLLLAFTRGACWALDVTPPSSHRSTP
jgi:hypothetical protein